MELQNKPKKYGFFTTDREFANNKIDDYARSHRCNIAERVDSINESYAIMEDGTEYRWIKLDEITKWHKCSVAVVDLATCDLEFIEELCWSICEHIGKENFVFIDSKYKSGNKTYDLHDLIDRLQKVEKILGNIPNVCFWEECGSNNISSLSIDCNEVFFSGF